MDTITVRITNRIGKGIRTAPRDALIADSVDESNTGKEFGIHRFFIFVDSVKQFLYSIFCLIEN
jgi:hypothetical protein